MNYRKELDSLNQVDYGMNFVRVQYHPNVTRKLSIVLKFSANLDYNHVYNDVQSYNEHIQLANSTQIKIKWMCHVKENIEERKTTAIHWQSIQELIWRDFKFGRWNLGSFCPQIRPIVNETRFGK